MSSEFGTDLLPTPLLKRYAQDGIDRLIKSPIFHGIDVPHGKGESVVLIPGYTEDDEDLKFVNKFIENIGYKPHSSNIGRNLGFPWQFEEIAQTVKDVIAIYGNAKVWGHSLGGFWGMLLAKGNPQIDTVIALGSPFLNSANTKSERTNYISVYSPGDRLVPNATSRLKEEHNTKNIVIESPNHFELIVNENVYLASAKAMGQSY